MNWYIAKMVFQITVGADLQPSQFDEQLRLIEASDKHEAFQKARIKGAQEEDSFFNQAKEIVKWNFIDVAELIELNKIEDGIELYSKIKESSNGLHYIYVTRQKALALETQNNA